MRIFNSKLAPPVYFPYRNSESTLVIPDNTILVGSCPSDLSDRLSSKDPPLIESKSQFLLLFFIFILYSFFFLFSLLTQLAALICSRYSRMSLVVNGIFSKAHIWQFFVRKLLFLQRSSMTCKRRKRILYWMDKSTTSLRTAAESLARLTD